MSSAMKDYEDIPLPFPDRDDPESEALPYPEPDGQTFTGGWSGSDTSHERALREADDGTLTKRLGEVHRLLNQRRALGCTWREVAYALDLHHGQASSALSNLHRQGAVVRLKEDRRDRSAVYVLPEYAQGREEAPYGRRKPEGQVTLGKGALEALEALSREEGYEDGLRAGRRTSNDSVLEFTTRLREVVLTGKGPLTHTKTCYTKHPECALLAVQRYLREGLQ